VCGSDSSSGVLVLNTKKSRRDSGIPLERTSTDNRAGEGEGLSTGGSRAALHYRLSAVGVGSRVGKGGKAQSPLRTVAICPSGSASGGGVTGRCQEPLHRWLSKSVCEQGRGWAQRTGRQAQAPLSKSPVVRVGHGASGSESQGGGRGSTAQAVAERNYVASCLSWQTRTVQLSESAL
jgi:hypothetical protein